jgi:ribosomal-protein-alanine N-acetyltransferase
VIRRLVPGDAVELAALLSANREANSPYWPDLPSSYFTVDGQRVRIDAAEHLYGILDGAALSGTISLSNLVRGPFRSASLGYWVDAGRANRGLATRAVAAMLVEAFSGLRLHRLEAATLVDNLASQRVLAKNGFTSIGLAPRYLHIGGAWRDHLLFQRTAED